MSEGRKHQRAALLEANVCGKRVVTLYIHSTLSLVCPCCAVEEEGFFE